MSLESYEGVAVGVAEFGDENTGEVTHKMISLSFKLIDPPKPEEPEHDDNYDMVFLSLPMAKSMLIDLRDAIDSIVNNEDFN